MSLSTISIAATAIWVLVKLVSPPADKAETEEYLLGGDLSEGNYLYIPSPFKDYPVAYYRSGRNYMPGIKMVYFELNFYRNQYTSYNSDWATVAPDAKPLAIDLSTIRRFKTQKRVPIMILDQMQRKAICEALDRHSKDFTELMDGFQVHGVYSSNVGSHMNVIFIVRKYAKLSAFRRIQEANKESTLSITISEAQWNPVEKTWVFTWKPAKEDKGKEPRVTNLKVEHPSEDNTGWIWCSEHDRWKIVWDVKGHIHVGWAHRYWSPTNTMREAERASALRPAVMDTPKKETQGIASVLLEKPVAQLEPPVSSPSASSPSASFPLASSPSAIELESSVFTRSDQDEINTTATTNSIVSSICAAANDGSIEGMEGSQTKANFLDGFYKNLKEKLQSRVQAKRKSSAWEHVTQIYNIGYPECETTGVVLIDSGNGMVSLIDEETARAIKATKVGGVSTGAGIGGADFQIDHHVVVGIKGDKQDYQVLCGVVDSIGDGYNVLLNDRWIEEYHPEARPHGFMIRGSKTKKSKKQKELENEQKQTRKADQEKKAAEREEERQATLQQLDEQRRRSQNGEE